MCESQFCGAVDADEIPSSGAADVEGGSPVLCAADVAGGSPFCDAVGAVDGVQVCCGWCGTALTEAGAVAGGTDQWGNP